MAINTTYAYSDEWQTPKPLFDALDAEFRFEVDLASTDENALCPIHYTRESNALNKDWSRYGACFLNPPFGPRNSWLPEWVERAATAGTLVVCVLPAKVEVTWFHDFCYDAKLWRPRPGVEIRFPRGRIAFRNPIWKPLLSEPGFAKPSSPPCASMIVIFRGRP